MPGALTGRRAAGLGPRRATAEREKCQHGRPACRSRGLERRPEFALGAQLRGQSPQRLGNSRSGCSQADLADETKTATAQTLAQPWHDDAAPPDIVATLPLRGQSPQR
mmetsp:Transcript_3686/g.11099  ORF Transcript_3686/g.11099 Transcript_3686/m.11099 type:complete len:108 (-) Transcript_3686:122-445(-)